MTEIDLKFLIKDIGDLDAHNLHIDQGQGQGQGQLSITGISVDSRSIEPGNLFVALNGAQADGAKFVNSAIKNGAAAVLGEPGNLAENYSVPLIKTQDAHLALAKIAARFFKLQPDYIAAVTGTAGKTSVAYFLRQIWEQCGCAAAFIGTTGVIAPGRTDYGNLTTPDPVTLHRLLMELASNGVTHAAMEASSHGLDQKRLHGVQLNSGGFTNLGRDHLDYHDNVDDYFAAKMRLFTEVLEAGSPAIIFSDDPYSGATINIANSANLDVKTVGRAGEFIKLKRVEHKRDSQIAELEFEGEVYRVQFPFAGDFQISNALVAAGLAIASGCDCKTVFTSLEKLSGAPGRLEMVGSKNNFAPVYVDYAHKPEAMENVLNSLRPFATGRLVIVFGCGGDRDPGKRPIMGEIASRLADRVIITDDNPRTEDAASVRREILSACPGAEEIGDRKQAIVYAINQLQEGDCLVIAGKGHETGQIVGSQVLEFSDHQVARDAIANAIS